MIRIRKKRKQYSNTQGNAAIGQIINDHKQPGSALGSNTSHRPILEAGTVLIGAQHAKLGLSGFHALDISPEMLAVAMRRGCYSRSIEADLTARLPLLDDEFGGVVSAGTFTHDHVGPDAFDELLRVARAGALFALAINAAGFGAKLARLPIAGLTLHEEPIHGPGADPAHRGDRVRITAFRSV